MGNGTYPSQFTGLAGRPVCRHGGRSLRFGNNTRAKELRSSGSGVVIQEVGSSHDHSPTNESGEAAGANTEVGCEERTSASASQSASVCATALARRSPGAYKTSGARRGGRGRARVHRHGGVGADSSGVLREGMRRGGEASRRSTCPQRVWENATGGDLYRAAEVKQACAVRVRHARDRRSHARAANGGARALSRLAPGGTQAAHLPAAASPLHVPGLATANRAPSPSRCPSGLCQRRSGCGEGSANAWGTRVVRSARPAAARGCAAKRPRVPAPALLLGAFLRCLPPVPKRPWPGGAAAANSVLGGEGHSERPARESSGWCTARARPARETRAQNEDLERCQE